MPTREEVIKYLQDKDRQEQEMSLQEMGQATGRFVPPTSEQTKGNVDVTALIPLLAGTIAPAAPLAGAAVTGGSELLRQFIKDEPLNLKQAGIEAAFGGAPGVIAKAAKAVPKVGRAIGKSIYGVSGKGTEILGKRPKEVLETAGRETYSQGVDILKQLRQVKNTNVSKASKGLNDTLSVAAKQGKTISIDDTIKELIKQRNAIEPIGDGKKAIAQLDQIIEDAKQIEKYYGGQIPVDRANEVKRQLQSTAFAKDDAGNPIYGVYRKDPVGKALKPAAAQVREKITQEVPDAKKYNEILQKFAKIEEKPEFRSLTKERNIEKNLKTLASETGNKGSLQKLVKEVDELYGTKIGETAENIYAAQPFTPAAKDEYVSKLVTGRSLLGAGAGGYLGGKEGGGGGALAGMLAGGLLTSPAVYRTLAPKMSAISGVMEDLATKKGLKYLPRIMPRGESYKLLTGEEQ